MKFSSAVVLAAVTTGGVTAFLQQKPSSAFVNTRAATPASALYSRTHSALCGCHLCSGTASLFSPHRTLNGSRARISRTLILSADPQAATETEGGDVDTPVAVHNDAPVVEEANVGAGAVAPAVMEAEEIAPTEVPVAEMAKEEEEIPSEVESLDGINSEDEAHNAERPARKSLKKKGPRGTPLAELNVGDTVTATVKNIASYGAFMDIGAETDGLLHISQLSVDYVSDVSSVLEQGKEYEVRITGINLEKKQVSLSLLTAKQEEDAIANSNSNDQQQQERGAPKRQGGGGSQRRDDTAVVDALKQKGWDSEQFVEGTVVSTLDFGAFVRVDCSQLNPEIEGTLDGLVHISAMAAGRVNSVTDVVKPEQKVQVRIKGIDGRKVALTMVSSEDEQAPRGGGDGGRGPVEGNKDWKEALEAKKQDMPVFSNKPVVVNKRS